MTAWRVLGVLALAILAGCERELSPQERETVRVGVFFRPPRGETFEYVGDAVGASACQRMAAARARSLRLGTGDAWEYNCCTYEKGRTCYRKIR